MFRIALSEVGVRAGVVAVKAGVVVKVSLARIRAGTIGVEVGVV